MFLTGNYTNTKLLDYCIWNPEEIERLWLLLSFIKKKKTNSEYSAKLLIISWLFSVYESISSILAEFMKKMQREKAERRTKHKIRGVERKNKKKARKQGKARRRQTKENQEGRSKKKMEQNRLMRIS